MKKRWLRIVAIGTASLLLLLGGIVLIAIMYITHRVDGSWFNSEGVPIHYTDEGSGTPVILIHGFAVNADLNWRRPGITEKLVEQYRVISVDLRGHGESGKPHAKEAYGRPMVMDILRLMDHLKLQKAHLAGYSLGGFIILKLAVIAPERILSASVMGAGWEQPESSRFLEALAKMADALSRGESIPPVASELDPQRKKPGLLHTAWVRIMTGWFNDQQALIGVIEGLPWLAINEKELRGISVPVCSVVGDKDLLSVGAKAMAGRVKGLSQVIIADADHMQAPMRPELLAALTACLENNGD